MEYSKLLRPEYELLHEIGRGTGGPVYLALSSATGEMYAIKSFPASKRSSCPFLKELSLLLTLSHPNIITCADVLYDRGDKHFLVLEYANGGSLRDLILDGEAFSTARALDIIKQVSKGLEHAHHRNIVHRDLKPENILICREEDETTRYKIADLGIAANLAAANLLSDQRGSPAYMSPEQFYDVSTPRSDLYALGIILYELIVGDRPFQGPPSELVSAQMDREIDLSGVVDRDVRHLIADLTRKDAERRMPSAGALIKEIDRILCSPVRTSRMGLRPRNRASELDREFRAGEAVLLHSNRWISLRGNPLRLLSSYETDRIYISDGSSLDRYEIGADRFKYGMLNEEVTGSSNLPDGSGTLLAGSKGIYRLKTDGQMKQLFVPGSAIRSILAHPHNGSVVTADWNRVYGTSSTGKMVWKHPLPNYLADPILASWVDGTLLATTGPTAPKVIGISGDGEKIFEAHLERPAIALIPDMAEHASYWAICSGYGGKEPAKALYFQGDRLVDSKILGLNVFFAMTVGPFLALILSDYTVKLLNRDFHQVALLNFSGPVLSIAWMSDLKNLLVLESRGLQARLNIIGVSAAKVPPKKNVENQHLLAENL